MLDAVSFAVELAGVAALVAGLVVGVVVAAVRIRRGWAGRDVYRQLREDLGRAILLGLELLVAADILRTVGEPTPRGIAMLAAIVVIRTFLSFTLSVEIEGRWPWTKATACEPEHGQAA